MVARTGLHITLHVQYVVCLSVFLFKPEMEHPFTQCPPKSTGLCSCVNLASCTALSPYLILCRDRLWISSYHFRSSRLQLLCVSSGAWCIRCQRLNSDPVNICAPCILDIEQAYRYSPEYAFYIFSQEIHLIIFFRLSLAIFVYSSTKCRVFTNVILLGS